MLAIIGFVNFCAGVESSSFSENDGLDIFLPLFCHCICFGHLLWQSPQWPDKYPDCQGLHPRVQVRCLALHGGANLENSSLLSQLPGIIFRRTELVFCKQNDF